MNGLPEWSYCPVCAERLIHADECHKCGHDWMDYRLTRVEWMEKYHELRGEEISRIQRRGDVVRASEYDAIHAKLEAAERRVKELNEILNGIARKATMQTRKPFVNLCQNNGRAWR